MSNLATEPPLLTQSEAVLIDMVLRADATPEDLSVARLAVLRERIPADVGNALVGAVAEHGKALTPKAALEARERCLDIAARHPMGRVLLRELDAAFAADKERRR